MALKADLYLDQINITRYLPQKDCVRSCGFSSCCDWLEHLRAGSASVSQCKALSPNLAHALEVVLSLESILPPVEITQHPVKGILGLHPINEATPDSPVLVTGNGSTTQEVMMSILSTTTAPFYLLFVDCLGHTVDMAMVYGTFTPEQLLVAIEQNELISHVHHRNLILPGVTHSLKDAFGVTTGWEITMGPHCGGELPLYLGEVWRPPRAQQHNPGVG